MRRFAAIVVASTLVTSSAFAAGTNVAPLAPGKPAGVKEANLSGNGMLYLFGLAILGGGIALVASQGTGNNVTNLTTTTTTTTATTTTTTTP